MHEGHGCECHAAALAQDHVQLVEFFLQPRQIGGGGAERRQEEAREGLQVGERVGFAFRFGREEQALEGGGGSGEEDEGSAVLGERSCGGEGGEGVVRSDPHKETSCRRWIGGRRGGGEELGELRLTRGVGECGREVESDGGGDVFFQGGHRFVWHRVAKRIYSL